MNQIRFIKCHCKLVLAQGWCLRDSHLISDMNPLSSSLVVEVPSNHEHLITAKRRYSKIRWSDQLRNSFHFRGMSSYLNRVYTLTELNSVILRINQGLKLQSQIENQLQIELDRL